MTTDDSRALPARLAVIGFASFLSAVLGGCFFPDSSSSFDRRSDSGETGGSYNGEKPTGPCVKSKPITTNETWSPEQCPDGVRLTDKVEVQSGAELTIAPGTRVKGESEGLLRILPGAALIARGTPEKRIQFTGWQPKPGAWHGISIRSNNVKNVLTNALVENGGTNEEYGAVRLASDFSQSQVGSLEMTDVEIRGSSTFGLYLDGSASFTKFERIDIHDNADGAAWVEATAVSSLRGVGNTFHGNGPGNLVRIETDILLELRRDATWPDVSPAVYRVVGQNGTGGDLLHVKAHLTIEPGATFEMAGGSGILLDGGTSGLAALGTPEKPIVFRGISGSSWQGITFAESTWAENRLENVNVSNAIRAPEWDSYGTGGDTRSASILLGSFGYRFANQLSVSNLTVTGPNAAPFGIAKKAGGVLNVAGVNVGLAIEDI